LGTDKPTLDDVYFLQVHYKILLYDRPKWDTGFSKQTHSHLNTDDKSSMQFVT